WGGTRRLAEAIAEGIHNADPQVDVRLFNSAKRDKNDIMTEIFASKAILLGSPTINKGILTSTAAIIEEAKGLKFRGKQAAAFGPYGWSGESVSILNKALEDSGFKLVNDGLKTLWEPDEAILDTARNFGKEFVAALEKG
ncbi:MAG: flavodoxin domain-containing protein, partial [Spirochaetaceae bacterium]|nr:flavodoxin domain-containing protein [Spirochaetaceae bacterium]MCF7950794.1 flavodoxin domain-containing protein [Spirochaetaceae bacterium]